MVDYFRIPVTRGLRLLQPNNVFGISGMQSLRVRCKSLRLRFRC